MLGLALEGGGAKGAYHMGAVKAFFEEGYEFKGIAGTSIGAINGAIIAQGDFEAGYRLWENMDTSLLFDIEEMQKEKILNRQFDKEALAFLIAQIKGIIENKGLDTSKIRTILDEVIDEDKLRQSDVDLGIVTVSMPNFEPLELYKEDIPYGKIVDYIMASANIPVFKIEPLDGKFYIDGAFYDNCPVNLLARKGYKDIIAIRTLGLGKIRKLEDDTVNLTTLVPSENLGRILNFDNGIIKTNLKMGYYDTVREFKHFVGKKYYLQPVETDLVLRSIWNLPDDTVERIRAIMVLPKMETKRLLFERVLPDLFKLLDLPGSATYPDIIIGVLEHAAAAREIDRFKVRTLGGLLEELNEETLENKNYFSNLRTRFTSIFSKEAMLNAVAEELITSLKPEQFC
jgi:NTE family protein